MPAAIAHRVWSGGLVGTKGDAGAECGRGDGLGDGGIARVGGAGLFVYKAYWQIPAGVRAEVQSIDGSASLITDSGIVCLRRAHS